MSVFCPRRWDLFVENVWVRQPPLFGLPPVCRLLEYKGSTRPFTNAPRAKRYSICHSEREGAALRSQNTNLGSTHSADHKNTRTLSEKHAWRNRSRPTDCRGNTRLCVLDRWNRVEHIRDTNARGKKRIKIKIFDCVESWMQKLIGSKREVGFARYVELGHVSPRGFIEENKILHGFLTKISTL